MSGVTGIIGSIVALPGAAKRVDSMAFGLGDGVIGHPNIESVRLEQVEAFVSSVHEDYEPACVGWNAQRTICLVFVGDDFDLDRKVPAGQATANGALANPAESLIRLYEQSGTSFISQLNGIFCGVLMDLRTQRVILFNDRYGLGRIYLHETAEACYFSSQARSLLKVLPHVREIDQRGLGEFVSVGCVLQNRSLFKGISLLPPASLWTFEPGVPVKRQRYFDARKWEEQTPLSPAEYSAQLAELFGQILPKYFNRSRPAAMSLTGGLDSRMVLASAHAAPGTLSCYTFGGPYRDCADVRIARELARVSGQSHQTIPIANDFFRHFTSLAEQTVYLTDGAMDVSGAVELYVNRLARKISPYRITGNYGSEILRANVAFRPSKRDLSLFTPEFRERITEAGETYHQEAKGNRLSFIAFKQVPWHHYGRFAAEKSQLTPRSPFLDNALVALAFRAPPELVGSALPLLQLISRGNPALDRVRTDQALREHVLPVIGGLAQSWQKFTAKAEYAYDYGMPTWLARANQLLKPARLERLFLGRHKFYHFRIWYRDQLSSTLKNGPFQAVEQPACYAAGARHRIIEEHTSGRFNRTLELHKLLSVQLLHRLVAPSPWAN